MAIKITGLFKPSGQFPLLEDVDLLGGFRVVSDVVARDAIPEENRKWGMMVYVIADDKVYVLKNNNNDLANNDNWEKLKIGGEGNVKGYTTQFTNDNLINRKLSISHNLNATNEICSVVIKDNNGEQILPDSIVYIDENKIEIDFSSWNSIDGTWTVLVTAYVRDPDEPVTTPSNQVLGGSALGNTVIG